jgi:hypothetical protein
LIEFKSIISGIEADLQAVRTGAPVVSATSNPFRPSGGPNQTIRVLLTGVPIVHGAERVLELIEDAGAVVVAMENCTGLKPILDDVDLDEPDPLRAIARKYYHLPCSVMTPNTGDLKRFARSRRNSARTASSNWSGRRASPTTSNHFHVRKLAEEELPSSLSENHDGLFAVGLGENFRAGRSPV